MESAKWKIVIRPIIHSKIQAPPRETFSSKMKSFSHFSIWEVSK